MDNQVNEELNNEIKNESSVNLKGIKDVTLNNGQRILIMFKNNSSIPTVININSNLNLTEEIKRRQEEHIKYQGFNSVYNTEMILEDIAKEQNSYETIKSLDNYEVSDEYKRDTEKLKRISALIKKANEKNRVLSNYEKFTFIDEKNNCIISNTGKVLEAEYDPLKNEVVVESPDSASEFRDEEIDNDSIKGSSLNDNNGDSNIVEQKDDDYSDLEIDEVYEEVFYKGGIPVDKKDEIISNLKKMSKDPNFIETLPPQQQEWYYSAYDLMKSKKKTLIYTPKDNKQTGSSNGLLIAIIVLFIVFAVFMYIIFRR